MSKYGVFSCPYFSAFRLNMEFYGVNLRIQSNCWKIRIRKNSVFGHFPRNGKGFLHIVMDLINIFCVNTFTFIVPCVEVHFKGPSREISRLLRNRLSNVSIKLEISNVKAGRKKYFVFFRKSAYCFFAVNTEYVIKHQQ